MVIKSRRQRAGELSKDQRIAVQKLRLCEGMTIQKIAIHLDHTPRQVQTALKGSTTPREAAHSQQRKAILRRIKAFLAKDPMNSSIPWNHLGSFIEGCENWTAGRMRNAMKSNAYLRSS
jgi:hypothetical protein